MEEYSSTPLFTVGQEIGNFLLSCGILSKAWEESDLARNSESFSLTEHEGVAYVAFPSFNKIESFIVKVSEYGEGNIQSNNKVFSDCLRGNDDKPALVHQGALELFLHIMEKTDFQAKLQIYTDSKQRKLKPIIFVGHSLGGAVATLATLWVLEKRLRQSSPFCITFGCPLVGDANLVEAVGRENWVGNFLHVVSKHDIVPRMFLAPLKSIAQPLTAIFPYWHGKPADSFIQDACKTLLENVRQCTCTVVNYEVDSFGGSDGVIEGSPYKPFGTYMFCSSHGAACIDNSETILMMLHLTMQSQELLSDNIVKDWFSEHIGYGSVLKPVIENSISCKRFAIPDSESSYEMGISLQLEAIGVGAQDDQTRIFFLPIAGDIENHLNKNVTKLSIELSFKKCHIAELEWYKERCEKEYGITYYDSFKSQDMKDIVAGDRRVKLGDFWDEIIEMWESYELPSDFESQNKWINAGNTYRRLVEPLDIAHYYLTNGNNYLSYGRPNRHKVLQRWMEAKEKTCSSSGQRPRTKRASLTQDSCFWAYVEEAWKDLENLKQGQDEGLQNLEKFEEYVTTMENALSISSDVFLEGSSFMMWWEEWKEFKKNQSPGWSSPLYNLMESESRFSSTVVGQAKISTTGVENTNIPSTGVVNENILSTQEIDCAQLRKRETELIRVQGGMFELELYKMICDEKGDGYYDTFKNRNDESDISSSNAILRRAELNQFWDEIIGMCESRELPRDFQSRNKWINAGTVYRELAEPLDIAHYYRTCRGSGNYISDGRQKRHEVLEKWLEGSKTNRSSRDQKARTELPFLTRDSCFWARVEEALKDQKKESLEKFEGYVTQMIKDNKISLDVFMERSSFMKWWQAYKQIQSPEWKLKSPLYEPMKSEFWKRSKPFLSGRRTSFNFTDVVKEESPSTDVVKEEIPSTKEESPSTGGVIKNIPSTKEIDCAQLRKRETELATTTSTSMVKKSSFSACTRSSDPMAKSDASSSSVANCPHDRQNSPWVKFPWTRSSDPMAKSDASSSSAANCPSKQNDVPAEGDASASSTSSASVTLSALTKAVCEDARNVNLDDLIKHISELLEKKDLNKKGKKRWDENKTQTPNPLPTTSAGFSKLREFLSKGIDCISALKDKFPSQEAKEVAQDVINGIGQVHFAVAGLLLISNILERMESLSENEARRLILLDEMFELAKHIKELNALPQLREAMEETNKKGTELIMEASLMCCYQINRSKINKWFSTSVDKSELDEFKDKLQRISREILFQINLCSNDAIMDVKDTIFEGRKVHPPKPRERPYPENAVGIEEPLKKVMELLDWESEESAVAVILHGIGGIGKSTLAEAVFAQDYIEGCRFSKVILDDATSTPDIVKLQKVIIEDLKIGEEIPDIRTFEGREGEGILDLETTGDGQRQIGQLLEKNVAFIYIDNDSKGSLLEQLLPSNLEKAKIYIDNDSKGSLLEQLLPSNLEKAKKLRVLITTRNTNVLYGCHMKTKVYTMERLNREQGLTLLKENIYNVTDDIKGQLDKIVDRCCGIPILLKIIAGSIRSEGDIDTVMEDIKDWKGNTFGEIEIEKRLLGYLPDECREPFLDICCFFKGWDWETVADIVGKSQLQMLEKRALVSKDENMTVSVNDVILDIGKKEAMNTRFELTSATQIEIQQFLGKETEDIVVIKGLMLGHQSLPAEKLNLMHKSLRIFAHTEEVDGDSKKLFEKLLFYKGEAPHFPFEWWQLTELRFLNCRPQNLNLLKEIPPTLTHIELDGRLCSDVSEISSSDIQRLKHLRVLRLINFKNLKNLAGEWGADVTESLEELTLSNCTSIEKLTGSISMLKNLKILNLEHCSNLKQLPDDFGSLSSLEILKISDCDLEELPKSISKLQKLKIMTMNFCNIRRFPKDCEPLSSSLKELNLRNCTSLKALPTSLGNALDSVTRLLFEYKGVLTDSPSAYESDTD